MQILTMSLLGTLVVGIFLIFEDYHTIPPPNQFDFSPFFHIGCVIVVGVAITFAVIFIKRKTVKPPT
jgi:hypothetical protein